MTEVWSELKLMSKSITPKAEKAWAPARIPNLRGRERAEKAREVQ